MFWISQGTKLITERRHDVDAVRVIVLFLLIAYHSAISFQPWGWDIGFITNDKSEHNKGHGDVFLFKGPFSEH